MNIKLSLSRLALALGLLALTLVTVGLSGQAATAQTVAWTWYVDGNC